MDFGTGKKLSDQEKLKNEYFRPLRQIIQKAVNQLILIRSEIKGQGGQGEGHGDHYRIREVLNRQRRRRTPLSVHVMKYRNVNGAKFKGPVKQIFQNNFDWNDSRKLLSWNENSGASGFDPNFLVEHMKNRNFALNFVNLFSTTEEFKIVLEKILLDMNRPSNTNKNINELKSNEEKSDKEVEELKKDLEKLVSSMEGENSNISNAELEIRASVFEAIRHRNKSSNNQGRETTGNDVHVEIDVMDDGDFIKRFDRQATHTSAPTILCHVTPLHVARFPLPEKVTDVDDDSEKYFTPKEEFNPGISPSFYTAPNRRTPSTTARTPSSTSSNNSQLVFRQMSLVPVLSQDSVEFLSTERDNFILAGRGTYGCVYLANVIGHDHIACVKEFFPEMTSPEDVAREAMILNYLQDTGVVPKFYGILMNEFNKEEISLVQDFYGNGMTLKDLLYGRSLKWDHVEIIQLLLDLTSGLLKIHRKNILCNDVKADNILVDCNNKNKIVFIDFGVATYRVGRCFYVPGKSSLYSHLAPEVRCRRPTSCASDVYSLGHLMTSIFEVYPNVVSRVPALAEVVRSCLDGCPALRPNLEEIIAVLQDELKSSKGVKTMYLDRNNERIKN